MGSWRELAAVCLDLSGTLVDHDEQRSHGSQCGKTTRDVQNLPIFVPFSERWNFLELFSSAFYNFCCLVTYHILTAWIIPISDLSPTYRSKWDKRGVVLWVRLVLCLSLLLQILSGIIFMKHQFTFSKDDSGICNFAA